METSAPTTTMNLGDRLSALRLLGEHLRSDDEYLKAVMQRTAFHNAWFTLENQEQAIRAIAHSFLLPEKLDQWLAAYSLTEPDRLRTVALVMAGNLPLVGFHDWLCVFVSGHRAQVKLSEKDPYLFPYLMKLLAGFDARAAAYTEIVERLGAYDAVIATGSNNSARYFEAYFSSYPHIIRKNRNGVAVLTGRESREQLLELGKDLFRFFGLGCRSVSKIYVPRGYAFEPLLEALHEYRDIVLHSKYKNNFDYHFAMHILNRVAFLNNGCILLKEDSSLQSRVGELNYEFYDGEEALEAELQHRQEEIQCLVAEKKDLLPGRSFPFGKAQEPELWDYADATDTLAFLGRL